MSAAKIMMKPLAPATNASARNILAASGHHWPPVARATMSAFGHRASSVSSGASSDGGSNSGSMAPEKPKRKRQRLDHLTQEEKIMRRKLKNRMAAQSARDRKKMKMQDLEGESKELRKSNEMLTKRNALLTKRVRLLELENEALRGQLLGADMVPATVAASALDGVTDSAEENMLQLMANFTQEAMAKNQRRQETEYDDDDDEDDEYMDDEEMDEDEMDIKEEHWSDAEEDLHHNESDNSSDVSDDSGLVLTTSSVDSTTTKSALTSSPKASAKSSTAVTGHQPQLAQPRNRSRVAAATRSGLSGGGVLTRTTAKGARAGAGGAGGRRRGGGGRGGEAVEVGVKQSGALYGDHLNVLVQQSSTKQQQQLQRGGLSAGHQQQQQESSAEDDLLNLNIAPSEIDELLDSLVQFDDEQSFLQYGCPGGVAADLEAAVLGGTSFFEQTTTGPEDAASDAAFDPDSLLNSFPSECGSSVEQLFASIDQSTLELTSGGGSGQSSGRQSEPFSFTSSHLISSTDASGPSPSEASRSLSATRSSSPDQLFLGAPSVDHDYATTSIKVAPRNGTLDMNNNNDHDLFDSLLSSSFQVNKSAFSAPISPLSNHSGHSSLADVGYESGVASPVGSESSPQKSSPMLSSTSGLFDDDSDEQEMMKLMDDSIFFGDNGGSSTSLMAPVSLIDPMLIDPTFLDRFPEMF